MFDDFYAISDERAASELGKRLERLRLDHRKQLTQLALAREAGISRSTYQKLIEGKGTLVNFIAVLRVLEQLEQLNSFLPEQPVSPVQLLKFQGKVRQRVKPKKPNNASQSGQQRVAEESAKYKTEDDLDW